MEQEGIETFMKAEVIEETGFSARRNIVVRGCSLYLFVGRRFCIVGVTLQGLLPLGLLYATRSCRLGVAVTRTHVCDPPA